VKKGQKEQHKEAIHPSLSFLPESLTHIKKWAFPFGVVTM